MQDFLGLKLPPVKCQSSEGGVGFPCPWTAVFSRLLSNHWSLLRSCSAKEEVEEETRDDIEEERCTLGCDLYLVLGCGGPSLLIMLSFFLGRA